MSTVVTDVGSELSPAELDAWRGLLRAHGALVKTLDAELDAAHRLPLSSYEVLRHLHSAPERRLRMCELAESVQLSRSGASRLVDRLERHGYVARENCEQDARGAFAVLTGAGARALAAAQATHIEGVRRHFLSHFSPRELDALRSYWERLLVESGS